MQKQNQDTRTSGTLTHPEATEWMAFIFGETSADRRRELGDHLADCSSCASQVKEWQTSRYALNSWKLALKPRPDANRQRLRVLKWAIAACAILAMGIWFGRQTSPAMKEMTGIKSQLAELRNQVERGSNADTIANTATAAANTETLRLLTHYSAVQDNQRTTDQQTLKVTLEDFDTRLSTLRTELETVAVNTEGGFQQTRQNLARLVSFSQAQ